MYLRLFRHFVPLASIMLGGLDGLLIVGYLFLVTSFSLDGSSFFAKSLIILFDKITIFWIISIIVMSFIGLYSPRNFASFGNLASRIVAACALIVLFSFTLPPYAEASTVVVYDAGYPSETIVVWLLWVTFTRGAVTVGYELGLLKRRILVLGSGQQAASIAELAAVGQKVPFTPVSFVGLPGEAAKVRCENIASLSDVDSWLVNLASQHGASEIVVATDERRGLPVRQLLRCKIAGVNITEFLDFWERETRTVDLGALRPSWLFYSDGFRNRALDAVLKRGFDIVVSLALLLLSLPLQLLIALSIKLESPGPIFYCQERMGRYGQVFIILKFRSMRADAEQDGTPTWATEHDPRITRVGAIIRKLRFDELPQLINVLRGEMSFVGPRPERPLFVEQLTEAIPYYAERHWVRPGITGWAQVNYPYGASIDDAKRKLSYDLYYMKNASIFLDFLILLQTIPIVLSRSGAR